MREYEITRLTELEERLTGESPGLLEWLIQEADPDATGADCAAFIEIRKHDKFASKSDVLDEPFFTYAVGGNLEKSPALETLLLQRAEKARGECAAYYAAIFEINDFDHCYMEITIGIHDPDKDMWSVDEGALSSATVERLNEAIKDIADKQLAEEDLGKENPDNFDYLGVYPTGGSFFLEE